VISRNRHPGSTFQTPHQTPPEDAHVYPRDPGLPPRRASGDPSGGQIILGEYASRWYQGQDLAASTMQNCRRHIKEYLLPQFNEAEVGAITKLDVDAWEKLERERGYAQSSVKTWRSTLHLILGDAVDDGLRDVNPATKRRGPGQAGRAVAQPRTGKGDHRRARHPAGRRAGGAAVRARRRVRRGRAQGLQRHALGRDCRPGDAVPPPGRRPPSAVRVEWQLYELDQGELHHCPPKDDSYRTIDTPEWLSGLLARHISRKQPMPCSCHGRTYAFSGHGTANGAARRPGAKLVDVARRAGVSTGTASNVLNRPEATRIKVEATIAELGYVRNASTGQETDHWRRSGFGSWLFHPATTGLYPKRAPYNAHPVPLLAEPWPGLPIRGRGASQRAQACWLPIAPGLTPHGLRHTHKSIMEEVGTPPKLMDERLGHEDGSVQSRYSHVPP
jgi:Bacterial regulatory proteins, lacI family